VTSFDEEADGGFYESGEPQTKMMFPLIRPGRAPAPPGGAALV
jgi:hypothetical protein